MQEEYTTVRGEASAETIEKKSRFIATVKPVETEEEAALFLNALRQKYWDATHNVYAYIVRDRNIQRYSDDGEPSGTAGVPVLDLLKKEGLTDVIVVVTRYFGGTLLGTGGLVHAYSKSAKAGVQAAGLLNMLLCSEMRLKCDYTMLGKVQNEIAKWRTLADEIEYTDDVVIPLYIPVGIEEAFEKSMTDRTNGRITINKGGLVYKAEFI